MAKEKTKPKEAEAEAGAEKEEEKKKPPAKKEAAAKDAKDKDKDGKEEGEEGAEGEESAEGEGAAVKKSGKKIILIGLLALILVSVPIVLYLLGIVGGHKESGEQSATPTAAGQVPGPDQKPEQVVYYDLEEFIVNLNVGSKKSSFLKMTVSLELPGESQIPFIESKLPRIRDSFQIYLRELRSEDLQGSAGIYRLREELLLRINKIVYPSHVNDILFKEILVQ